jgi:hypothetical protein
MYRVSYDSAIALFCSTITHTVGQASSLSRLHDNTAHTHSWTPMDEWSARRRELYYTEHSQQTSWKRTIRDMDNRIFHALAFHVLQSKEQTSVFVVFYDNVYCLQVDILTHTVLLIHHSLARYRIFLSLYNWRNFSWNKIQTVYNSVRRVSIPKPDVTGNRSVGEP